MTENDKIYLSLPFCRAVSCRGATILRFSSKFVNLDVVPEGAMLRYDEHALLPVEGRVAGVEDGEQCAEMGRRYQHLKRKENIVYYVYAAYCIYMHKM